MTVSTPASREADRITRRTKTQTDDVLRASAQAHMDARQERLEAYVRSLQVAIEGSRSLQETARLQVTLAQAQRDATAAAHRRVPRAGTSAASLVARALPPTTSTPAG